MHQLFSASIRRRTSTMLARLLVVAAVVAATFAAHPGTAAGPLPSEVSQVRWSASDVRVGEPVTVTGQVSPSTAGRVVYLEQHLVDRWVIVRRGETRSGGAFSMPVPTTYYQQPSLAYRVRLAPTSWTTSAVSEPHRVSVDAPYTPTGSRRSWARVDADTDWQLQPCSILTYRINPMNLPPGARRDMHAAIRKLSQATGIRARYLGPTSHRGQTLKGWPADTNLVIAWLREDQSTARPFGGDRAYGGPSDGYFVGDPRDRLAYATKAIVVVKAGLKLRGGFGNNARGNMLLHELGHVAGLGHVERNPGQMMSFERPVGRYQAGDLTGLRALGRLGGCGETSGAARSEPSARAGRGTSTAPVAVARPIANLPG